AARLRPRRQGLAPGGRPERRRHHPPELPGFEKGANVGRRRSAKPRRRGGASRRSRRPTAQQAYRALGLATAAAVALAVAVVAYVLVVYPDRAKDGAGRELSFTLVEGES